MPQHDMHETNKDYEAVIANMAWEKLGNEDNLPNGSSNSSKTPLFLQNYQKFTIYTDTAFVGEEEATSHIVDWLEKKDSFTQTTLLKNQDNEVQDLIFKINRLNSIPFRKILVNKLLTLFNDAKEEDTDCIGVDAESLRNFISFLQSNTNLKFPNISLTPEYKIYASWRGNKNQVFSVHFLQNGDTRFVIFKPNKKHPKQKIRLSGVATTDILMETVSPYRMCRESL